MKQKIKQIVNETLHKVLLETWCIHFTPSASSIMINSRWKIRLIKSWWLECLVKVKPIWKTKWSNEQYFVRRSVFGNFFYLKISKSNHQLTAKYRKAKINLLFQKRIFFFGEKNCYDFFVDLAPRRLCVFPRFMA